LCAAAPLAAQAKPQPRAKSDGAARDTTARTDSAGGTTLVREVYSYEGGGRDPFVSLLRSGDIRPLLSDLRLVGIYYDSRSPAPRIGGAPGRDGEVKAVSVLPAPGRVEVVIDLRGAVEVQDFTLASPARLVLDLQGARLVAPAALYDGQNRGGIKNVRYAQFR